MARCSNRPFLGDLTRDVVESSTFSVIMSTSGPELIDLFGRLPRQDPIVLPVPAQFKDDSSRFVDCFFSRSEINLAFDLSSGGNIRAPADRPSHQLCEEDEVVGHACVEVNRAGGVARTPLVVRKTDDNLPKLLGEAIIRSIFVFQAQRLVSAIHRFERHDLLDPVGSSLPAALLTMQGERPRDFDALKDHFKAVIPEITNLTVIPVKDGNIDVRIWSPAFAPAGQEVSFSLSECGTGVGQVLAILQVAMTPTPMIIAIDEPNSFLHPGAAKQLLKILSLYRNQYIITTHSSDIVSSVSSQTVNLVQKVGGESIVRQLDVALVDDAKRVLSELGVSFSDVFGAEKIVWVEGETEQGAFPKIILATGGIAFPSFLAVKHTGDFQKKGLDSLVVFSVYERLSAASSLLPTTVRFSFDRENLSPERMNDIIKRSNGAVSFLPRRAYENYLLHSRAIEAVIKAQLSGGDSLPTSAEIESWLSRHADRYAKVARPGEDNWLIEADVPRLLKDMFQELTQARLKFRKPLHPLLITDWLIKNDFEFISELTEYVMQFANLDNA